jgi:hypothetical protein
MAEMPSSCALIAAMGWATVALVMQRDSVNGRECTGAASPRACALFADGIGSQGHGAREGPFPRPPFNPYVQSSRIRLTGDPPCMVMPPSDSDSAAEPVEPVPA